MSGRRATERAEEKVFAYPVAEVSLRSYTVASVRLKTGCRTCIYEQNVPMRTDCCMRASFA